MIVILILVVILCLLHKKTYKKWYQCKKNESTHKLFHNVLVKKGLHRVYNDDWDIYLPCEYSDKSLHSIRTDKNKIVGYVSNNKILGSKLNLWTTLVKKYGRNKASTIMPVSYVFPKDTNMFHTEFDKNAHYVLKSEKQRQEGIKLSNNFNDIVTSYKEGYKIVQKYVDNPLTHNNHKINFRIYLLIVCKKDRIVQGYVYNDGVVSYSKSKSDGNVNFNTGVSSFYSSKQLYDKKYPITITQYKKLHHYVDWVDIDKQIHSKLGLVVNASKQLLCNNSSIHNSFQLFGTDFIITTSGECYLLEINIGPAMTPYNTTDKSMRERMYEDMLSVINKDGGSNFTKLLGGYHF